MSPFFCAREVWVEALTGSGLKKEEQNLDFKMISFMFWFETDEIFDFHTADRFHG
ncbi:hypothetical protein OAK43_02080 [Verrucomicrobiales bacterium]|jgi:hypothetical protein|nr:hypothetical protein [Verrucomicrobiales bacterium]